jgi:membrane-associated phospholipid phosphatase
MLLSIPAIGYHYFVDVLAGVAIAGMAAIIAHRYFGRFWQTST